MFKLNWDQPSERKYHTGVDRGVVYPQVGGAYPKGEAWNGLTNVTESPSGAEPTPFYANNHKYAELMSVEEFAYTIEAYMYPDSFGPCIGEAEAVAGVSVGQQSHQPFGFTYRNILGNDEDKNKHGYILHIVYGSMAKPSERAHNTVNDSPELETMSWECSTTPVELAGFEPTAHISIDSTKVAADKLAALEAVLYGSGDTDAKLPNIDELLEILGYTPVAG